MKFVIILTSLFLLIACKKDKEEIEDTVVTLKRKWTLESEETKLYYNGNGTLTRSWNVPLFGTTTYDFQNNGTLIVHDGFTNYDHTLLYTINGDSVNFNGYNHAIKNLTSTNVTLLTRETDPQGYVERLYNLKR